jgi:hypothetical protein
MKLNGTFAVILSRITGNPEVALSTTAMTSIAAIVSSLWFISPPLLFVAHSHFKPPHKPGVAAYLLLGPAEIAARTMPAQRLAGYKGRSLKLLNLRIHEDPQRGSRPCCIIERMPLTATGYRMLI